MASDSNPHFTGSWDKLLFLAGTWTWITKVIQSPVFRISSFLPVVGYMILYGDAFQGWFRFSVLGDELVLSPSLRLHFLYWGGILIFAATAIQAFFCPALIKRFPDQDAYVDNFIIAYSPRPVVEAVNSLSRLTAGHHSRAARFTNLFNPIAKSVGSSDKVFLSLVGKGVKDLNREELDKLNVSLRYLLASTTYRVEAQKHCVSLIEYNHAIQTAARPTIRILTVALALVGILLASLPAFETFLRVIILDIDWLINSTQD